MLSAQWPHVQVAPLSGGVGVDITESSNRTALLENKFSFCEKLIL